MNTMIAYAAGEGSVGGVTCGQGITNLTSLINWGTCTIMHAVIPLLGALALAGFVYGIIKYFLNPDNEEKRKDGKSFMLWGLITLFVIVSIWGLVRIFSNTFLGTENIALPKLPEPKQ